MDLRRSSGGVEGIYRCDIRLSAGAARTSFYVGLYLAGSGIENTFMWQHIILEPSLPNSTLQVL